MGFKEVRRAVIKARREGRFQHEERSNTGEISAAFVVTLLKRCKGDQHQTSTHHFDESQIVHIFKPFDGLNYWYIKCYLIEVHGIEAIFISVHQ